MIKRWRLWVACLAGTVVIAVLATIPETRYTLLGFLRGERFYSYRPTSYWSWRIRAFFDDHAFIGSPAKSGQWYACLKDRLTYLPDYDSITGNTYPFQDIDASAIPMLAELIGDADPRTSGQGVIRLVYRLEDWTDAAPTLNRSLKHAALPARELAIRLLEGCSIVARATVAEDLLADHDLRIRVHAAAVLLDCRLGDRRALHTLADALVHDCHSMKKTFFARFEWDEDDSYGDIEFHDSAFLRTIFRAIEAATKGPDLAVGQEAVKLLAALNPCQVVV